MRNDCIWIALLGLALCSRSGAEPPTQVAPGSVEALIEQLGAPDYRLRDQASQRLEALGMKAVEGLRKALGHPDAEVRRRARDLIPLIETNTLLTPRRVSLKVAGKPLRAIFDEFTRQTGYQIEFWTNNPAQTYSFDFRDLLFWEALDRVCRQAGLTLQQNFGNDHILLQQQDAQPQYIRYEGAFRLVPLGLQQTRFINFLTPSRSPTLAAAQESLVLQFTICSEPRLPLLGIGEPQLQAAYDTEKNSLLPNLDNATNELKRRLAMAHGRYTARYGNGNRTFQLQSQVNLVRPSLKASAIKTIRGSLPVTLLAEQKPVVVADKVMTAKGKKATVGTTSFVIDDIREMPAKQYRLKLSVTEDTRDNPNDYTWMNTLYQRIELLDENGNRFQVFSTGWGNSGSSNVELNLVYGPQGGMKMTPPSKFIFQQWTTSQTQIHFEFRDLPLP